MGNRISVCFEYEYHDAGGQWYRAYGQIPNAPLV